jgi:hypothetical protein
MEYFIVFTAVLCVVTYFVYIIANKFFHIHLRLKPLIICACCALFIGNISLRFVIGFTGLTGIIGIVLICAVVCSYLSIRYNNFEEKDDSFIMPQQEIGSEIFLPNEVEQEESSLIESHPSMENEQQSASNSLDDLIERAFIQKNELQLADALKTFTTALLLYKDTDSAPMIIVEMGSIFKALGQYDEAVQLFSDGRNLPSVKKNNRLNQQFIEMIAFLRIIKANLLEHQIGCVPYDKIPLAFIHKINDEFQEWLSLSHSKP